MKMMIIIIIIREFTTLQCSDSEGRRCLVTSARVYYSTFQCSSLDLFGYDEGVKGRW